MVNLLKISLIILILTACSTNYEISNKEQIHQVKYSYEDLYLDNIDFKKDKDNNIVISEQNWKIIKTNLVKIHYYILKLQSQIDMKGKEVEE